MLQAFQVSELQYPAYTSDYKHGCHGSPKRSIRDRSLNRQTFGYTYVRIPYIERLVLPTFFTKYTLLSPGDVTNPPFLRDLHV